MIEIEELRKSYNGQRALDGFSLRVEEGELFGLVGPNGAGKTTLIKILATLLPADGGRARVAGYDVAAAPRAVKPLIGYLPDVPGLYQDMRVSEFLEFFADAFRLPRLLPKPLLHEPRVLLLDEPATGLDPLARIELREHLKALNRDGVTIFISSHILSDLEDICSRVALIANGRNAADVKGRTVLTLQEAVPPRVICEIEVAGEAEGAGRLAGGGARARARE